MIFKLLNQVQRNLRLLKETPIEFLYTFTASPLVKVKIEAFNPRTRQLGFGLKNKIEKILPTSKVHFIGSSALGIPGQKDIDILIECNTNEFKVYQNKLAHLLGKPSKSRSEFIEWDLAMENYKAQIVLANPKTRLFTDLLTPYKILSDNKKLREEYTSIKLSSNGLSVREYNRRRLDFFNKILNKGD